MSSPAIAMPPAARSAPQGFQIYEHGHRDLVQAVKYNLYGDLLATGSSDGRIKAYTLDALSEKWVLIDTWRAHDGEIIDLCWNGPVDGNFVGSIGEDGKFKIWQENIAEMPLSGRRFTSICTIVNPARLPYASLDFKYNAAGDTFVALLSRDGMLTVYEAAEPESLKNWSQFDQLRVCEPPVRGEAATFKLEFDRGSRPCFTALHAGLEVGALSLVVAALDSVKVWRTNKERKFYVAADLPGHGGLVRDVSWAPGSYRGYDIIASTCTDGFIRVFKVETPMPPPRVPITAGKPSNVTTMATHYILKDSPEAAAPPQPRARHAPSGIGAGLAGAFKGESAAEQRNSVGDVQHTVEEVARLSSPHSQVWRVSFSTCGSELASAGDDGKLRVWKQSIYGTWLEYCEVETESIV
ncbi:MAG: epoxide hydrolase, soluble (sEH) [Trizodia sp. TS-e1964]|nr:MAG: epoxide hydrolase, soluble (sEH) [Trizodia sp. TS-e1964]